MNELELTLNHENQISFQLVASGVLTYCGRRD